MPELPCISPVTVDAASLVNSSRPRTGVTDPASLHKAAVQFESVLLGQWLESAEKSFATVPGSDDDADAGGEQMMSFGMQQFASAIASSGGLGIARLVERGLAKAATSSTPTNSTPSADLGSALPSNNGSNCDNSSCDSTLAATPKSIPITRKSNITVPAR